MSHMDVIELKGMLESNAALTLLDVREPYEWEIASIPGTHLQIPLKRVLDRADEVPKDRSCVVYCRSGKRSQLAIELLKERGHTDLFNLEGGILAWADRIDPEMERY